MLNETKCLNLVRGFNNNFVTVFMWGVGEIVRTDRRPISKILLYIFLLMKVEIFPF